VETFSVGFERNLLKLVHPNLYDIISSVKHKRRYFEEHAGCFFPQLFLCSEQEFKFSCLKTCKISIKSQYGPYDQCLSFV